jgi:cbb3-type cytochrome oxidase subunit 3
MSCLKRTDVIIVHIMSKKKTNSFDNRSVTFLQLNDDNTTIGPFVLVIVLICITYLLLTLARED